MSPQWDATLRKIASFSVKNPGVRMPQDDDAERDDARGALDPRNLQNNPEPQDSLSLAAPAFTATQYPEGLMDQDSHEVQDAPMPARPTLTAAHYPEGRMPQEDRETQDGGHMLWSARVDRNVHMPQDTTAYLPRSTGGSSPGVPLDTSMFQDNRVFDASGQLIAQDMNACLPRSTGEPSFSEPFDMSQDNRVFNVNGQPIEGYCQFDGQVYKITTNVTRKRKKQAPYCERPEYAIARTKMTEAELQRIREGYGTLLPRLVVFTKHLDKPRQSIRLSIPEVDRLNDGFRSVGNKVPRGNPNASLEQRLAASEWFERGMEIRRAKARGEVVPRRAKRAEKADESGKHVETAENDEVDEEMSDEDVQDEGNEDEDYFV